MNKRGQELSTNTIIIIILAVVVLVILILGFTLGWSKIIPWLPKDNVQSIVTSCSSACATQNKFNFCNDLKELNDGTTKTKSTCYYFSKKKTSYGIEECLSVDCGIYDSAEAANTAVCNQDSTSTKEVTYLTDSGQETKQCGQLFVMK